MFALHEILQEEYRQLEECDGIKIPRVIARDRGDPLRTLTEEEFVERYRLSKNGVADLHDELQPIAPRIVNGRGM